MPGRRLHSLLRRAVDVKPDEARAALYLFIHLFLVTFSIYVIKPIRENLLIGIAPVWWPYADLITAGLIGFIVVLNTRLLRRVSRRRYFSASLAAFILSLLPLGIILDLREVGSGPGLPGFIPALNIIRRIWPAPIFLFSFWCDIFIVTSMTQFWMAVNDVFNPRQAKKAIGFLVTGGLLGGIAGSLLTSRLVQAMGPANLLLGCPVVLLLTVATINLVYAEQHRISGTRDFSQPGTGPERGSHESLRTILEDKYLRRLAGFLASALVAGTLINYQFKIIVKAAIPSDVARTAFLGSFYLGILLLSAAFHLFATGQLLKTFGIRMGLLVSPAVLLLGTLAVFFFPPAGLMVWACAIRASDKTLDTTISQSARELLYMPIPEAIKYEAKVFIDMFVNKFAVGVGAVLFWVLFRMPWFAHKSPATQVWGLGVLVSGFALVSIALIWSIYSHYLAAMKKDLARRWPDAHKVVAEGVEADALLMVDTLQSRDRSETLYAMNLFHLFEKAKLTPELIAILSSKESELKARSLDSLLNDGGGAAYWRIEEAVTDAYIQTTVREVMALDSYKGVINKRLLDVIGNGSASEVERMEAAKLAGLMEPTPEVLGCLSRLLQDPSPEVLNYALGSAASHLNEEHLPFILTLLGNPLMKHVAQNTLATYGTGIEELLCRHLQNAAGPPEERDAIPEVLARFGTQKCADILTTALSTGRKDMEECLISALYRIRSNEPGIRFDKKRILTAIRSLLRESYGVYLADAERASAGDPPASIRDVRAIIGHKVKCIFDLLTLVYPSEDIVKAYQNLLQGTRKSVDFSLELLDNILDRDLKVFLFPLIEDLPAEEKARRLQRLAHSLGQRPVSTDLGTADSVV